MALQKIQKETFFGSKKKNKNVLCYCHVGSKESSKTPFSKIKMAMNLNPVQRSNVRKGEGCARELANVTFQLLIFLLEYGSE